MLATFAGAVLGTSMTAIRVDYEIGNEASGCQRTLDKRAQHSRMYLSSVFQLWQWSTPVHCEVNKRNSVTHGTLRPHTSAVRVEPSRRWSRRRHVSPRPSKTNATPPWSCFSVCSGSRMCFLSYPSRNKAWLHPSSMSPRTCNSAPPLWQSDRPKTETRDTRFCSLPRRRGGH